MKYASYATSEVEQKIVIEAEQRTLEGDGKGEIVLRQQECIGERHQVDDRNVLGEHETIGAAV